MIFGVWNKKEHLKSDFWLLFSFTLPKHVNVNNHTCLLFYRIHIWISPISFRKLQAFGISNDFSKVTRVVTVDYQDLVNQLKKNQVIVKNLYVGINASDVNFTNGKYIADIKP